LPKTIGIIDYGVGNLTSVVNALSFISVESKICTMRDELKGIHGIILPGVGSFPAGMQNLESLGIIPAIVDQVKSGLPLLGICLGMQLLATSSDEFAHTKGLDLIPGTVKKLDDQNGNLRIPHIGWNGVVFDECFLAKGLDEEEDFYFVHSYGFSDSKKDYVKGISHYGNEIVAVVEKDNIFGTQFHPEKSQKAGLEMLRNFSNLC
jgi:glutamine amidotransferase